MSGGSVRDRIRAAEALQGGNSSHSSTPTTRKGHKLALHTDQHIKEEFLRRGDGGWSKNVDIGHQQPFMSPPPVPFIKVTTETPVVAEPREALPGKLLNEVPGAFEPVVEVRKPPQMAHEREHHRERKTSGPSLAEQREVEEFAEREVPGEKEVLVSKYESLLDDHNLGTSGQQKYDGRRSRSRSATPKSKVGEAPDHVKNREKVIFEPGESPREDFIDGKKRHLRHRRRRSSYSERAERRVDATEDRPHKRNESRPYQRRSHEHHGDEDEHKPRRRNTSRSTSRQRDEQGFSESQSPHASLSRQALWPSFSKSERRSMSDLFEISGARPRSSHSRTRSDVSEASIRSELSPKQLEFAEYVAGKKLDNVSVSPLRPAPRPMGFVRSRSLTGNVAEHFTREKALLRKPSDDDCIVDLEPSSLRRERLASWHAGSAKHVKEPWQVKILQSIAKM